MRPVIYVLAVTALVMAPGIVAVMVFGFHHHLSPNWHAFFLVLSMILGLLSGALVKYTHDRKE